MERERTRQVRWIASLIAMLIGGGVAYWLGSLLLELPQGDHPSFVRLLISAYGALVAGYVFTAGVARLAPGRRYPVSVALVFATVLVAAGLMLGRPSDQAPLSSVLLGVCFVLGAFGHALKVRGFSESVSSPEG